YLSVIDLVARESKLALSHIVIGGKSMGGRIATHIAPRANVGGLVLLGYPLHAVGKPDVVRDEHLYSIHVPCLFVSGDRDSLCTLALMKKVVSKMKRAAIFVVEDGDHSFKIRKNPARTQEHVFADVREQILLFLKKFK
ncbi:MAG TPA: dienelactone hydrolase family protein, partial [Leptospiraceae bacterium]|nr:dienelactone hydrolase family protein [Leptospiraceae bacterium]